jgi:F0F1-type ATP synthase assembly protein I
MISLSRLVVGIIFILFGIFFLVLTFFGPWWLVFYSIVLFGVGIAVLLNKNEDKIEEREDKN